MARGPGLRDDGPAAGAARARPVERAGRGVQLERVAAGARDRWAEVPSAGWGGGADCNLGLQKPGSLGGQSYPRGSLSVHILGTGHPDPPQREAGCRTAVPGRRTSAARSDTPSPQRGRGARLAGCTGTTTQDLLAQALFVDNRLPWPGVEATK